MPTSGPAGSRWWSGVAEDRRAISTVADVALALVLIVAAIAVVSAALTDAEEEYDPATAPQTAETLGAATVNLSYSLAPMLAAAETAHVSDPDEYAETELDRTSHGPILGQVARAAQLSVRGDGGVESDSTGLSVLSETYLEALDERVQARLVESQARTNVTARWEPVAGGPFAGVGTVGKHPPHQADTSVVRLSVPAESPSVRDAAIAAVEDEASADGNDGSGAYDRVAVIVAGAMLDGLVPDPESQRSLEGTGLEREVTVLKYRHLAAIVADIDPEDGAIDDHLSRVEANTTALDSHLADALAEQLADALENDFERPREAAEAVSTGEVTVSITTWEP